MKTLQVRLPDALREEADSVLNEIGMDANSTRLCLAMESRKPTNGSGGSDYLRGLTLIPRRSVSLRNFNEQCFRSSCPIRLGFHDAMARRLHFENGRRLAALPHSGDDSGINDGFVYRAQRRF